MDHPTRKFDSSYWKIEAESYVSFLRKIQSDLFHFQRFHFWEEGTPQIDTFGNFWLIGHLVLEPGQLSYKRNGELFDVAGDVGVFIPPHGIVEWCMGGGEIAWEGYIGDQALSPELSNEAIVFKWEHIGKEFANADEAFQYIAESKDKRQISKVEKTSALARRLKDQIDSTFDREISISDLTKQLGFNHSVATRAFKDCFGIPPLTYRNRKRLFDSIGLILKDGNKISSVAQRVGFKDISRFNKQFKKTLRTVPSSFT